MGNCSPHPVIEQSCIMNHNIQYYDVYNVDAKLFKHSKGQIHITKEELILNYKNALDTEPIKWPLKGLRRYGYHKDIFLFECGRRCPTGQGLFAFKCNKAKRLNDSLQKAIVNNSTTLIDLNHNEQIKPKIKRLIEDTKSPIPRIAHPYLEPKYPTEHRINEPFTPNIQTEPPYYVNDIKDLVGIPLGVPDQLDPCILHIVTKSFNDSNKLNDKTVKQSSSSSSSYSSNHNVIYAIPERFNDYKHSNKSLIDSNDSNQQSLSDDSIKLLSKRSHNEISSSNSSQIEYSVIDPNKGQAIQNSQKQIQNKRMEYSMINYKL